MAQNLDQALSVQVFEQGKRLCSGSLIDCTSYHYMRPLLRRIGAVPSPYTHQDFYVDAIQSALAGKDEAQINISGTADYSWILEGSPLMRGLSRAGTSAQIDVTDGCPTPTTFSMLASKQLNNHMVEASVQNITEHLSNERTSDLIVTDAFLTQFVNKEHRLAVLRQWERSLKLGGYVITTVQLAKSTHQDKSYAKKTFIDNAVALYAASDYSDILRLNTTQFKKRVHEYSNPNASRIYTDERELTEEIYESGLSIADMTSMSTYSYSNARSLSYRGIILSLHTKRQQET